MNDLRSTPMNADGIITLDIANPVWDRVFMVAPLVVIGTREADAFDLAPKHMAMPMGWTNYFGFMCAPSHGTYHNAKAHGAFTVSFPRPEQVAATSLAATRRQPGLGDDKPILRELPTRPASRVEGVFLDGAYLMLECELHDVMDGFGENSLVVGRVVAAHAREDALCLSDADHQRSIHEAPLLAYVNPGRYAVVQQTQAFPFPADFRR